MIHGQHDLPRTEAHNSSNFSGKYYGVSLCNVVVIAKFNLWFGGCLRVGNLLLRLFIGLVGGGLCALGIATIVIVAIELRNEEIFCFEYRTFGRRASRRMHLLILRWVDGICISMIVWHSNSEEKDLLQHHFFTKLFEIKAVYSRHFRLKDECFSVFVGLRWGFLLDGLLDFCGEVIGLFQHGFSERIIAQKSAIFVGQIVVVLDRACHEHFASGSFTKFGEKFLRSGYEFKLVNSVLERFGNTHLYFKSLLSCVLSPYRGPIVAFDSHYFFVRSTVIAFVFDSGPRFDD